jgi:hypothetical protein
MPRKRRALGPVDLADSGVSSGERPVSLRINHSSANRTARFTTVLAFYLTLTCNRSGEERLAERAVDGPTAVDGGSLPSEGAGGGASAPGVSGNGGGTMLAGQGGAHSTSSGGTASDLFFCDGLGNSDCSAGLPETGSGLDGATCTVIFGCTAPLPLSCTDYCGCASLDSTEKCITACPAGSCPDLSLLPYRQCFPDALGQVCPCGTIGHCTCEATGLEYHWKCAAD